MSAVKKGDVVKVHYTGKYQDGTVFDSSRNGDPLELTVGGGRVIPGFEQGVLGMRVGQCRTITLKPEDAYGQVRRDLIIEVRKKEIPENIQPSVGQNLQMKRPDGSVVNLIVSEVAGETVTLDANHPLAGKTLVFDIELMEIA